MSTPLQRILNIQEAINKYVDEEQKRIDNTVSVLTKVLEGRTGGAGIERLTIKYAEEASLTEIYKFLQQG